MKEQEHKQTDRQPVRKTASKKDRQNEIQTERHCHRKSAGLIFGVVNEETNGREIHRESGALPFIRICAWHVWRENGLTKSRNDYTAGNEG